MCEFNTKISIVDVSLGVSWMRLVFGWGTAAKSPLRTSVIRFFKTWFHFLFCLAVESCFLIFFLRQNGWTNRFPRNIRVLVLCKILLMKYSFCAKYRNVHSGTHKYKYEARSRNNVENSSYLKSLSFSKKKHLSTLSNILILCQSWPAERFHNKYLLSSSQQHSVAVAEWSNART